MPLEQEDWEKLSQEEKKTVVEALVDREKPPWLFDFKRVKFLWLVVVFLLMSLVIFFLLSYL